MSVTDLSTTIIWVSNTSEPICNRQKTATRREANEQNERKELVISMARFKNITLGLSKRQWLAKPTPFVVEVVRISPHQRNAQACISRWNKVDSEHSTTFLILYMCFWRPQNKSTQKIFKLNVEKGKMISPDIAIVPWQGTRSTDPESEFLKQTK